MCRLTTGSHKHGRTGEKKKYILKIQSSKKYTQDLNFNKTSKPWHLLPSPHLTSST